MANPTGINQYTKGSIFHTKLGLKRPKESVQQVRKVMNRVGKFSGNKPAFTVHPNNLKQSAAIVRMTHRPAPAGQVIFHGSYGKRK